MNTQNEFALRRLEREYPESQWSCSVIDESEFGVGQGFDVTFQRYKDDAEDRYSIQDGVASLV
jgi:hypothetical protein